MKKYITLICAFLATVGMTASAVHAGQHATDKAKADAESKLGIYGHIDFYEGYGGNDDVFCRIDINQRPWFHQKKMSSCNKNDEAKSAKFTGTPAGTILKVYDNPNCDTGDDYAVIQTKVSGNTPIIVHHFESNDLHEKYTIRYYWQDGNLDGKVSCVEVIVPES